MSFTTDVLTGDIVEEEVELTLTELGKACSVDDAWLLTLVEEGILEPQQLGVQLSFSGLCIHRVRVVQRLQRDLGLNLAGAALALDLLDEIDALQARISALETAAGEGD